MMTKPGEVCQVDLGIKGKVRPMVVVSRYDPEPPRSLAVCAPITTSCRGSSYEVPIGKPKFLRYESYVNVQGLQAVRHHELSGPVGMLDEAAMDRIKSALKYTFNL